MHDSNGLAGAELPERHEASRPRRAGRRQSVVGERQCDDAAGALGAQFRRDGAQLRAQKRRGGDRDRPLPSEALGERHIGRPPGEDFRFGAPCRGQRPRQRDAGGRPARGVGG